jgi:peroxiredoxin
MTASDNRMVQSTSRGRVNARVKWLSILIAALPMLPGAALAGNIAPGAVAPNFVLNSSTGKPIALADLKGQVVLINFWASWCGPCRQEMPILDQLYRSYQPAGFTLLGVNVEPNASDARKFLKDTPVTFPILFDPTSSVSKLYQVSGMPSTIIVDRDGKIRYVHHGYQPGDENQYLNQIRALTQE